MTSAQSQSAGLAFRKMHGLGNDFVVLDGRAAPLRFTGESASAIANRRTGVGCDQILILERPRNGGDAFMFLKQFCGPEATRVQKPVVVFLDVNMQGLSGFDVLVWARQQPELAGTKIFMLSGANEEWDAQIAAKLGADDYLEKFPPPDAMADLLSDVCTPPAR